GAPASRDEGLGFGGTPGGGDRDQDAVEGQFVHPINLSSAHFRSLTAGPDGCLLLVAACCQRGSAGRPILRQCLPTDWPRWSSPWSSAPRPARVPRRSRRRPPHPQHSPAPPLPPAPASAGAAWPGPCRASTERLSCWPPG